MIDEVGDLGKRERDRLISSIRLIMHHLLKWEYQPEKRFRSWAKTIQRERVNVQEYLEETPSLARVVSPEWLEKAYRTACRLRQIFFSKSFPRNAQLIPFHLFLSPQR
ncbi:MAG: DUF29 domain-containing protein [Cyanobacteria bacterium J06581_3]